MKLIGSTTSPYVRKVQLILADTKYDFETLKALSPEGNIALKAYGPINRIPILIDNDKTIFDSSLISEYLLEKMNIKLSIDEKLIIKMTDELCDACIILFQHKLWDIDAKWQNPFLTRVHDRAKKILKTLNDTEEFTMHQSDWLYCVLDWLSFRNVIDWQTENTKLVSFYKEAQSHSKYQATKF